MDDHRSNREPETPAKVSLDMARASARELAGRRVKRKPNNVSTASLAAHVASVCLLEVDSLREALGVPTMNSRALDPATHATAVDRLYRLKRILSDMVSK